SVTNKMPAPNTGFASGGVTPFRPSRVLIKPESTYLLSIGELRTIATKEKWLGIDGKTTWLKNRLQLLLAITT
ncbi:MAG: hypothetical protein ACK41Z_05145, partial [Sediminibacterium sp.]